MELADDRIMAEHPTDEAPQPQEQEAPAPTIRNPLYKPLSARGVVGVILVIVVVVLIAAAVTSRSITGSSGSGWSTQSGVTAYSQPLDLTLTSFNDPGTDSGGNTSDSSNNHFATVDVSATNNGNSTVPSSLPITITAFGSDGSAYERQTITPTGYFLWNSGNASSLSPSQTLSYCAGFVLPTSATVSRIEVSGNQGYGSGTVSWGVTDTFSGSSNSSASATQETTSSTSPNPSSTTASSAPEATSVLTPQLLAPNPDLDWSGFVISPSSCQSVGGTGMQVTGSVTVPSLVGRGMVVGEVEAWITTSDGTRSPGVAWVIPNSSGQFAWTVAVSIPPNQSPTGCEVQGVDPHYSYYTPQ